MQRRLMAQAQLALQVAACSAHRRQPLSCQLTAPPQQAVVDLQSVRGRRQPRVPDTVILRRMTRLLLGTKRLSRLLCPALREAPRLIKGERSKGESQDHYPHRRQRNETNRSDSKWRDVQVWTKKTQRNSHDIIEKFSRIWRRLVKTVAATVPKMFPSLSTLQLIPKRHWICLRLSLHQQMSRPRHWRRLQ